MNKSAEILGQKTPLAILADLGIKTSHQRVVILRYLLEHDSHPSADAIYGDLAPSTPGLSKTTVYNTLKLFAATGLVEELTVLGKEVRYDLRDPSHSHFLCRGCGRIFDIAVAPAAIADLSVPAGFQVEERQLYLKGLCPACASKRPAGSDRK